MMDSMSERVAEALVQQTVRVQVPNVGTMTGFLRRESAEHLADSLLAPGGVVAEMVAAAHRAEAAAWRARLRGHDRSGVMAFDREAAYEDGKRDGAAEVRARVAQTTASIAEDKDAAWAKYLDARDAASQAVWQGRFDGYVHALAQIRAALAEPADAPPTR